MGPTSRAKEVSAPAPAAVELGAAAGEEMGPAAASRAASQALEALGESAGLLLAFCSGVDPGQAAGELLEIADGVPHAGMMGKGAIGERGVIERGCAALAFSSRCSAGVGVGTGASRNLRAAGHAAVAAALEPLGSTPHRLVLLFLDPAAGEQAEAIAGAYEVAGPTIPLAGGGAGGIEPAQLAGGEAIRDVVVAVALASPSPISIGTSHGCRAYPVPSIVTRSEGRLLVELDGRPAEEVYLEKLGLAGLELDDGEFEAVAVTHPLAQPELHGDTRVRHIHGRAGGGALHCATRIPVNAAIDFTLEDPEGVVASAAPAVRESLAGLGGRKPAATLIFDCAGRKRVAGRSLAREIRRISTSFPGGPPPLSGLFTYGEVARTIGAKGDRNHALVVCTFAS